MKSENEIRDDLASPSWVNKKNRILIHEGITISELASRLNVPVSEVIKDCAKRGTLVVPAQTLDWGWAALIADFFNTTCAMENT